jgi:hypothetical protein
VSAGKSWFFNDTTPTAPTGRVNAKFQGDPVAGLISAHVGNVGSVDPRTSTSESIALAARGKLVTLANAAAIAVSLDSTVPTDFLCFVQVTGAGTATFTPTLSATINGGATESLSTGQSGILFWTGATWWLMKGAGSGGSFTAGGDLFGSSTVQEVIGILSTLFDSPGTAWADGQIPQYSASLGKLIRVVDRPIFPVSAVAGRPAAGQLVCIYTAAAAMIFPANFATPDSKGSVGVNPTATATYTVYKNGATVGTVTISTAGVCTFATTGGVSFTLNAGDRLTIVAPGSQDATLADVGITLVGTRSATVPAVAVPPIFTWRGTYSGGSTYGLFDVVAYVVSGKVQSYVCKLPTTGNAPTNTTYWDLLAEAGADGVSSASTIQQQGYIYAVDAGAANAYSVTLSPAPTVVDGSVAVWRATHDNTGASTLVLPGDTGATGATAKNIVKQGGTALAAGDIKNKQVVVTVWDNANSNWEMIGGGGGGNLTAKYVLGDADGTLTNAAKNSSVYMSPDVSPASADSMDDEFDDTSGMSGTVNGLNARWTWKNQGSVTIGSYKNGWVNIGWTGNNGSAHVARIIAQALPSAPYAFVAKLCFHGPIALSANTFAGLFFYENGTSKFLMNGFGAIGSANIPYVASGTANVNTGNSCGHWPVLYLKSSRSGTVLTMQFSRNGVNFDTIATRNLTDDFTTAPDYIGVGIDPYSQPCNVDIDFFRRVL